MKIGGLAFLTKEVNDAEENVKGLVRGGGVIWGNLEQNGEV